MKRKEELMEDSNLFANQSRLSDESKDCNEGDDDDDDYARFNKSLQELRDLRSQLHYAADYCKTTFLHATQKKVVLYNTKEYVCRAVVTVVDHLGNVSSNLDFKLSNDNYSVSDNELRLNCLTQRLSTSEEYANKLALDVLKWNPIRPSYHPRYGSNCNNKYIPCIERPLKDPPLDGDPTAEEMPIILLAYNPKPNCARNLTPKQNATNKDEKSSALPVRGVFPAVSKTPSNMFHFQDTNKRERGTLMKRTMHAVDKLPFIRRTKHQYSFS